MLSDSSMSTVSVHFNARTSRCRTCPRLAKPTVADTRDSYSSAPLLHYSSTPLLHHSISPHPITPLLLNQTRPSCYCRLVHDFRGAAGRLVPGPTAPDLVLWQLNPRRYHDE